MLKIHSLQDAPSTSWSGGTTTELFIFPSDSKYQDRNFDFRISSATIEVEESDFTVLPAYNRLLAVLEGELKIIHEGRYTKQLSRFESDSFNGSWITKSKGKAVDFNVIYSGKYALEFEFISLIEKTVIHRKTDFLFLFILNDPIVFEGKQWQKHDLIEVGRNEVVLDKGFSFFKIELHLNEKS